MISLTGEYSIRAMIFLAQHVDKCPIPARRIASEAGIPQKYLSSVLSALARAKVLDSSPGLGGGFSLARPAKKIMLLEVLAPFEQVLSAQRSCPFGGGTCSDDEPCPLHKQWQKVREAYFRFLKRTSIHAAAFEGQRPRGSSTKKQRAKR